jgi:hypothetical protein
MISRRIGFQPVSFAIDRLEAYPTAIWLPKHCPSAMPRVDQRIVDEQTQVLKWQIEACHQDRLA